MFEVKLSVKVRVSLSERFAVGVAARASRSLVRYAPVGPTSYAVLLTLRGAAELRGAEKNETV